MYVLYVYILVCFMITLSVFGCKLDRIIVSFQLLSASTTHTQTVEMLQYVLVDCCLRKAGYTSGSVWCGCVCVCATFDQPIAVLLWQYWLLIG